MEYNKFFDAFYIARSCSGITGVVSKGGIVEFLMKAGLENYDEMLFPGSESGYRKWMDGKIKNGSTLLGEIASNFSETLFCNELTKNLNRNNSKNVARKLGISVADDEELDEAAFILATAKQFRAIVRGNGSSDNIMMAEYKKGSPIDKFPAYARATIRKYEMVNILSSEAEDYKLDDVFVCNTLGDKSVVFVGRERIRKLENATLESIEKHTGSKRTALVGNCGSGKSMMLQNLFLQSIKKQGVTGLLPIFVELRDLRFEDKDLMRCIIESVHHFDESISDDDIKRLMLQGKCQLLMDGIDEIDPKEEKLFQNLLDKTVDKYSNNQYIITSRDCHTLKGIRGFRWLYLLPFDKDQTVRLVENLVKYNENGVTSDTIMESLKKGFMASHDRFASNPMMLTFIVQNYPIIKSFGGKVHLFYKKAYETFISEHDYEKIGYNRVFRSVTKPGNFTKVFREFCANTYSKQVFQFDATSFESYFNDVKCKDKLTDSEMMNKDNFLHDVCVTACMMYEEDSDILYFDRGFQQFLFAEYNYYDEPENMAAMGKSLWRVSMEQYESDDTGFNMLYEMSEEKTERYLFLPLLEKIYKNHDEMEAFATYMKLGFRSFDFLTIDGQKQQEVSQQENIQFNEARGIINEPTNVILSMIFKVTGLKRDVDDLFQDEGLTYIDQAHHVILYENVKDSPKGKKIAGPRSVPIAQYKQYADSPELSPLNDCITDESGRLICFGYECKMSADKVFKDRKHYEFAIEKLCQSEAYKTFLILRRYFEELADRYKEEEL